MAEGAIRHNEIIEIDKTLAGIQKIIKELKKLQGIMRQTAKETISFQQKQDPSTKGGKEGTKQATSQVSKLTKENERLVRSIKNVTKEQTKLKKARKDAMTEQRRQIQIMDSAKGSLDRNRVALQKLTERYNRAAPAAAQKMQKRISSLTGTISKQEKAIGKHQRNVGNYTGAFKKAKAAILSFGVGMVGATVIMNKLSRGIKNIIGITEDFEQGMANVKAITNASEKDFTALTKSAIDLGRVTKFTATQVAELQFEYAKLGFTTEEILNASKATLDLAAATGTDLARAAEVAGGAVRAFGLDARETKRVTDVMARSFATSALDMEKFAESMKMVSKVADVSELSIERTTAILGVLANNMIDSSRAGTALRKILAETGSTAEGFEGRLRELVDTGITLADAQDEVGKRAFGALLVLTEQWGMVEKLTIAYEEAEGAAERMAEIMLDTAKGQKTIVKSAWEGLVLTTQNSTEVLEGYKTGLTATAKVLNWVTENLNNLTLVTKRWFQFMNPMIGVLGIVNEKWRQRGENIVDVSQAEADAAAETERLAQAELKRLQEEGAEIAKLAAQKREQEERDAAAQLERTRAFIKAKREEIKLVKADAAFFEVTTEKQKDAHEIFQDSLDADLKALDAEIAAEIKLWDARARAAKEAQDAQNAADAKRQAGIDRVIEEGANVLFALTDLRMAKLQQEKDAEIEAAQGNKAKILEIEKKFAKEQQKVAISQALIDSSLAIVKTLRSVIFPFNIVAAALIAAQAGIQVAAIRSQTFAEGGHGELGGKRHSQGGTYLPGIGEAEKGEYFGIINRQMTRRYSNDLPAIFDSLNKGQFHDVWSNANIQLQENIDPWTKKIYDTLQASPTVYTDSNGDTVLAYPVGGKRIIKKKR